MAEFICTVYQNEFLPEHGTDVHAIVTVNCANAGAAGQTGSGDAGEVIVVDTSGSMEETGVAAARIAAAAAIDQILDGVWFAIVAGNHQARLCYPDGHSAAMVQMTPTTRAAAKQSLARLYADGGTAMGTWLLAAAQLFDTVPALTQRHVLLLTDGENQHETPEQLTHAIDLVRGRFQVDARGLGAAWVVDELRRIASALMGTVDLIPHYNDMATEFEQLMRTSMNRGVADARLRLWAPQGAEILFVRQVAPTLEELTNRRESINPLTGEYPTGAWGDESRDYHVAIRLPAKAIGAEQLAARVQIAIGGTIATQGLVKARWSADNTLTTHINPEVAHYTGQTEMATAIQQGLAAKSIGDDHTAVTRLGRAVQLAEQSGDAAAAERLSRVVDIDDAATGRVRLKRSVNKLDEMALDTASTRTVRVRK
ncbi:VWA domain-containing protein [Dermatophilus congolensis]|uniref:VWA domain-containing protein n=1 Tax=Dermatophilus congolensis TaxID=1863 RepID=UPI001AAEBDB6|nr:VWA domain-containing protein [Dermatophilus congolensis]MBO3139164.1 VWA domain-containing protein [Dermatophilus congolensis]MBO3148106.1 VWA domain-containing protein [Dermatophilus congolensis]MBO3150381.1 VWA domain-containing protein [Dermatophilus congolensis]MBO3180636.1 VWA domain-containing protein [Dermatophilus congolensis]